MRDESGRWVQQYDRPSRAWLENSASPNGLHGTTIAGACRCLPALFTRDIEASVVCVGGPVQRNLDLGGRHGSAERPPKKRVLTTAIAGLAAAMI